MKTAFDSCGGLFHPSATAGPGFAQSAVKSARRIARQMEECATLARHDESLSGRPLMRKVMEGGKRLPSHVESLEAIRDTATREMALLPLRLGALARNAPPIRWK